eukprot:scaffold6397_cov121-Isochrysis_galbana.AAC.9
MSLVQILRCFLRQRDSTDDIDSTDNLRLRRGVQTVYSEEDVRAAQQSPTKVDTVDLAACMHDETQRRNKLFEEVLHTQPAVRSSKARRDDGAHITYKMARAASTRVYCCGACGAGQAPPAAPAVGLGRPAAGSRPQGAARAENLPGRLGADGLPGRLQRPRPRPDPRAVGRRGVAVPGAPAVLCAVRRGAWREGGRRQAGADGGGAGPLGAVRPAPPLGPRRTRMRPVRIVCPTADRPRWHAGLAGAVLLGRPVPAAARRPHRRAGARSDASAVHRVRPDPHLHRPAPLRQAPVGLQRQPARESLLRQLAVQGQHQAPRRSV